MASTSGRDKAATLMACSTIVELSVLCMPSLARLSCQLQATIPTRIDSIVANGAPKGRHNPKSGDWDAIEVVVTTAIEVHARKRRQRQHARGQDRYLLQEPLLLT